MKSLHLLLLLLPLLPAVFSFPHPVITDVSPPFILVESMEKKTFTPGELEWKDQNGPRLGVGQETLPTLNPGSWHELNSLVAFNMAVQSPSSSYAADNYLYYNYPYHNFW